jgi:hypothetical protein
LHGSIDSLYLGVVFDLQRLQACVFLVFRLHHRGCRSVRQDHLKDSKIVTINSILGVPEVCNHSGNVFHHVPEIINLRPFKKITTKIGTIFTRLANGLDGGFKRFELLVRGTLDLDWALHLLL